MLLKLVKYYKISNLNKKIIVNKSSTKSSTNDSQQVFYPLKKN